MCQIRSNHEYHFIIKQLAEQFEDWFKWLGENHEKCMMFSIPIEKQEKRLYNTNWTSLLEQDLWSLADNFAKGLHKGKCQDYKSNLDTWQLKMIYEHLFM